VTKLWLVDCVNCGKQVEINGPEDICYWCGKNASKKEDIMQENKERTVETGAIPPKPKKRGKVWEYFDQNREAMVADYHSMKLMDFFKKWAITSNTWLRLKKKWGVENKGKKRPKKPKKTTTKAVKKTTSEDVALTEHERYLILLGYQQAVREFLRAK